MASKKKPNSLEFCRTYLRKKPKASFAEVRDAAAKKRIKLYPISYGRAQSLEGLIKTKKRKTGKKKAAGKKRGRPKGSKNKPRKTSLDGIESIVETMKALEKGRDQALKTLEKIRELLN